MTVSCLYRGLVAHRRAKPAHSLRYRVFQLYLDLDEGPALADAHRLFGFNGPGLISFQERDHGDGGPTPLKAQIEARLRSRGYATGGPVRVLCMPRVLGFVFNPISVFFCHGPDGRLSAIVYEVNNTFGDRTAYVLPAKGQGAVSHATPKSMHVSPLMEMAHTYDFQLEQPGERFSLAIHVKRGAELVLTAGFSGDRAPLTDRGLFMTWLADPVVTLKVVAGIHWEALRTWLKGARYRSKPHGRMGLDTPEPETRRAA